MNKEITVGSLWINISDKAKLVNPFEDKVSIHKLLVTELSGDYVQWLDTFAGVYSNSTIDKFRISNHYLMHLDELNEVLNET